LLGDADVLPIQVMREVEYLFTNSTHISSSPPYETVEDDDEINCKRPHIDSNTNDHAVDSKIQYTTTLSSFFTFKNNIQPRCQFKYNSIRSIYHVDIHAIVSHKLNTLIVA